MTTTSDKAIQLFTYLKELSKLRTTHTKDVSKYDKVLWFSDIPREKCCCCLVWEFWDQRENEKEDRGDVWVEVHKPTLKSPPEVPDDLEPWIKEEDFSSSDLEEPGLRDEITVIRDSDPMTGEEQIETLSINDYPGIFEMWMEYAGKEWKSWAEEDRRLQKVQKVYNDLYTIYQLSEKLGEQYEVVVGLGFLVWRSPNSGEVRHPLLTLNARVDFDRVRGIMSVGPAADGSQPRLEIDMLENEDRPSVKDQQAIQEMVDELEGEPWNAPAMEAILNALANGISTESRYDNAISGPTQISVIPQLHFAPSLILRKRTRRTFVDFYRRIVEQIESDGEVPDGVRRLVEIVEEDEPIDECDPNENASRSQVCDTELYFPLPTNEEQKRIAQRIEKNRGVLVQGPPGTGKSHTIVNLIAHLLAKGKRVLVTSETPRALEVLKKMLPDEIRELCVMWLGSGPQAHESLRQSVDGINQKKVNWEPEQTISKISELERLLDQSRRDQAKLRIELTACREADTYQHTDIFGLYSGTLEKIAIQINDDRVNYGWFLDRTQSDEKPRVTSEELIELFDFQRQLTENLIDDIKMRHLPSDDLILPVDFRKQVHSEQHAIELHENAEKKRNYPGYESLLDLNPEKRARMLDLLENLIGGMDELGKHFHEWAGYAAKEIVADQDRIWRELLEVTEGHLQEFSSRSRDVSTYKIVGLENRDYSEVALHARELKAHLDRGKGLRLMGLFRAKVVKQAWYLARKVRVDGEPCNSVDVLQKLIDWLELDERLENLADLWKPYTTLPQGNYAVQLAAYGDLCEPLRDAVALHKIVQELKENVSQLPGLASPQWHTLEEVKTLRDAVEVVDIDERLNQAKEAFGLLQAKIVEILEQKDAHPVTEQIHKAIDARDPDAYEQGYDRILNLNRLNQRYKHCNNIWNRFSECAPETAEDFMETKTNNIWETRFKSLSSAWIWSQADRWLSEKCSEDYAEDLMDSLSRAQDDERSFLKELAAEKAWQHCMISLGETERQALVAWTQAVRKIGRGTGRHAERFREEARQKLEECRKAIPAWVMPLYQVVQTTNPQAGIYDVVIVDEASQSGPEALLLNFLAKRIIIVGDDKQIAPLYVGVNLDDVTRLRQMHLEGIPHCEAFDVKNSLFSQAELRFPDRIRLREHFRCMPEIIQFSNNLSYRTEPLIPLRQFGADRLKPCQTTHVADGYRRGTSSRTVNPTEAEALVSQIIQCLKDPAYEGKSFGVISLLGDAQAPLIANMLMQEIGAEEIESRGLLCGRPEDFQGSERHVIFLSMVDAPQDGKVCRMVRDEKTQRLFNVAASRAKDQLWLFHSPTLNDLRTECLRYRLLEHCLNPHVEQTKVGDLDVNELRSLATSERRGRMRSPDPFDSWFEVDVFLRIAERGYRVLPQYKVAEHRIDLVVVGMDGMLAVECDGDEWHGPEQFNKDMERERQLMRSNWTFWRVRGGQFYRDPDTALQSLWRALEERGIEPSPRSGKPEPQTSEQSGETVGDNENNNNIQNEESAPQNDSASPEESSGSILDQDFQNEQVLFETEYNLFTPIQTETEVSIDPGGKKEIWPDPRSDHQHHIAERLIGIVEEHGPMLAEFANKVYLSKVGLKKLGRSLREIFQDALAGALRTGRIEKIPTHFNYGMIIKTPGQEDAIVRKIAGRDFYLIPPNEIQQLAGKLNKATVFKNNEELYRAILDYYAVGRLTQKAEAHLSGILNL